MFLEAKKHYQGNLDVQKETISKLESELVRLSEVIKKERSLKKIEVSPVKEVRKNVAHNVARQDEEPAVGTIS